MVIPLTTDWLWDYNNHTPHRQSERQITNSTTITHATNITTRTHATNSTTRKHATNCTTRKQAINSTTRTHATNSTTRKHATNCTTRTQATNSTTRTHATNSTTRTHATNSTTRTHATNITCGYQLSLLVVWTKFGHHHGYRAIKKVLLRLYIKFCVTWKLHVGKFRCKLAGGVCLYNE